MNHFTGQKAKMLAGELYMASDPELAAERLHALKLLDKFNATSAVSDNERQVFLTELVENLGEETIITPPFRCDYGYNITIGARAFINYDCIFLDCNRITIGNEVQIAPGVHIYTASHPLEANKRRSGLEYALPVTLEDGVWLGGGAIVCPGITIGTNTVIGAGSVVTRDLPANMVAAGNPCHMIRQL